MIPILRKYRRKEKEVNGLAPITIVATLKGVRSYHYTGIKTTEDCWDAEKLLITGVNAKSFNPIINKKLIEVEQDYLKMLNTTGGVNFTKKEDTPILSYFEYANYFMDSHCNKIKETTAISYKSHLKKFKDFAGNINFNQITVDKLQEFENHLYKQELKGNRINRIFKTIKQVAIHANKYKNVSIKAFELYKFVGYKQPNRMYLEPGKVTAIRNLDLKGEALNNVRDYYLISCYTGLRFSDLATLKDRLIVADGVTKIKLYTQKTDDPFILKVSDNLKEIIQRVGTLPTNQTANILLKVIGKKVGVEGLQFHSSRHTCASTLLALGEDIYTVSKMLTHKDIRTTTIYTHMNTKKMDETADKLSQAF